MGVPLYRWMVFVLETVKKRRITRGTPMTKRKPPSAPHRFQVTAWACDVSASSSELKKRLGAKAPTEGPRALAAETRWGRGLVGLELQELVCLW